MEQVAAGLDAGLATWVTGTAAVLASLLSLWLARRTSRMERAHKEELARHAAAHGSALLQAQLAAAQMLQDKQQEFESRIEEIRQDHAEHLRAVAEIEVEAKKVREALTQLRGVVSSASKLPNVELLKAARIATESVTKVADSVEVLALRLKSRHYIEFSDYADYLVLMLLDLTRSRQQRASNDYGVLMESYAGYINRMLARIPRLVQTLRTPKRAWKMEGDYSLRREVARELERLGMRRDWSTHPRSKRRHSGYAEVTLDPAHATSTGGATGAI